VCHQTNPVYSFPHPLDKPTVKLILSTRRKLICLVCAHPLPHRIQWWWNTRKERDDHIHQTNINQSCIAQQITFNLVKDREKKRVINQTSDTLLTGGRRTVLHGTDGHL
jgi:hypothetical protein